MGREDPSSHSGYRARAIGRQAQSQQRDNGGVKDREYPTDAGCTLVTRSVTVHSVSTVLNTVRNR